LGINVAKDQDSDTLDDLARRLSGTDSGLAYDVYKKLLITNSNGVDWENLQGGNTIDLTGMIAQTMNFENDATRLFQNSGLPQFLNEKFPQVDFTHVRLHKWNLPDEWNSNAWPNNTIGVGSNNYENWMATLNTLSIAREYGFNIDEKSMTRGTTFGLFETTIAYILHENYHLVQFEKLGTIPFLLKYIPEYGRGDYWNYASDETYFKAKLFSYANVLNDSTGEREFIFNPKVLNPSENIHKGFEEWFTWYDKNDLSTNPPTLIKVPTSLDTRADTFGYWGAYDFILNNKKYSR
jgi:hypothetical protein